MGITGAGLPLMEHFCQAKKQPRHSFQSSAMVAFQEAADVSSWVVRGYQSLSHSCQEGYDYSLGYSIGTEHRR